MPLTMRLARCFRRLLWALGLCLFAFAASAQGLRITQALSIQADSTHFPAERTAASVTLPHDWAGMQPQETRPVWYRVSFDAPGSPLRHELLGLYIERVCSNLEVHLNGERIFVGGSMREPYTRRCAQPQLVPLPAALLQPAGNLLDLKVVGYPLERVASSQRAAGLSALELGPHAALAARQASARLLRASLPPLLTGALLALSALMLVMAGRHRHHSPLRHFAALAIGWALLYAHAWWPEPVLPGYDSELLAVALTPVILLAGVLFLLGYCGYRSRPVEVALYAQCVIVPASLLLAGPQRLHLIASSWYVLLALQALAALGLYVRHAWRRKPRLAVALSAAAVVTFALALLSTRRGAADDGISWLAQFGVPVLLLLVGLRLAWQQADRLRHAEAGRQSMEGRVREVTEEVERHFAQLAELRVEQVTERERKRIAADLHDDLGAKLLTIVHTSDNERISTLAREALEEMRLSVRGLTGKPVRLIDALGDWRAEVVSRLQQAGIEAEWSSPTEDVPQTLTARAYVQTTRILREAVNNIIKHSGASRCGLRCVIAEGDFQLVIQDNGKGIPLELDGRLDRGHGMASMKHRAKQLHGQCLVESGPGYGTVIRLTLPLERQVEEA